MNQLVNFGVAVSGPFFLDKSSYGPYFMYGGFTTLGVIFGYWFMHEVRGKTLERFVLFSSPHFPSPLFSLAYNPVTVSIDEAFGGSPLAVGVPKILQKANLTEVRQRKNSRSQSATLPGETRDDIRRHMEMQNMATLPAAVEEEEEEEEEPVKGIASGRA
jgi:hypothetical protein